MLISKRTRVLDRTERIAPCRKREREREIPRLEFYIWLLL